MMSARMSKDEVGAVTELPSFPTYSARSRGALHSIVAVSVVVLVCLHRNIDSSSGHLRPQALPLQTSYRLPCLEPHPCRRTTAVSGKCAGSHLVTDSGIKDADATETAEVLEQYRALVDEIRQYCKRNEELLREEEDTIDESEALERRSRLSSTFTRKISLTCETLLRQLEQPNSGYLMPGEPRRSGGRLRSPEPSPSPSPVPSPVPPSSPRSRFHVSRVVDAASPVATPSLSSSPTRFFPTSSVSRFRVTVVDPSPPQPPPIIQHVTPEISIQTEISPSPERAEPVFLAPQSSTGEATFQAGGLDGSSIGDGQINVCVTVLRDKDTKKVVVSDRASLISQDSAEDTADLEVRQILSSAASNVYGKNKIACDELQSDSYWLLSDQSCEGSQCASVTPNGAAFHDGNNLSESNDKIRQSSSTLPSPRCQTQNARKLSWIMSESQGSEEPKVSSNIEKLLSLFRPTFFGKSHTNKETGACVKNMDPIEHASSVKPMVPPELAASSKAKSSEFETGINQAASLDSSHAGSMDDSDSMENDIGPDARGLGSSCLGILSPDLINNNNDKCDISQNSRSFELEDENFNITKDSAAIVPTKQSLPSDMQREDDCGGVEMDADSDSGNVPSGLVVSDVTNSMPITHRSDELQKVQAVDDSGLGGNFSSFSRIPETCPATPCGNRMDVDVLTNMFACWKVADDTAASSTNLVIHGGLTKSTTPVVVQMLADDESNSSSLMVLQTEPTKRRGALGQVHSVYYRLGICARLLASCLYWGFRLAFRYESNHCWNDNRFGWEACSLGGTCLARGFFGY
ncbi:hypothetical protein PR048_014273 [Dryococelus australis]|uniref:Uncharacterized protein n=1 Tax=Dryococelus australis TaxID=614101 RepID=A0ABQ9HDQ0_9NEOP|nr:hypothetical protein PR048_014273 [Dryococelus australis]